MMREPVSIVVSVGGSLAHTQACLDALRPTVSPRDEVIAVGAGIPEFVRGQRWIRKHVTSDADSLDGMRREAADQAIHDVVVFLDDDTLPMNHWLDGLIAPLADPDVIAVGPRTTAALGTQCVDVPVAATESRATLRRFAREWRDARRKQTSAATFLTGVCAAIRRDAALAGPAAALCGEGLVVAEEVFIPHVGTPACAMVAFDTSHRPLLTANLIVKDEAEALPTCLASLAGLVDDIVVYDTGSSDDTVAIAREAGVAVVEGYWNDHFSDARNRALEHCTGHWILWIDADEQAVGEFDALRTHLTRTSGEAMYVPIKNLSGGGIGSLDVFRPVRLFRNDIARYAGRLHEQIIHRELGRGVLAIATPHLELIHSGYLRERVHDRDKLTRNLRLAEQAVEAADSDGVVGTAMALCNLARSQAGLGHFDDARLTCERAYALDLNQRLRRTVAVTGVRLDIMAGATDDARHWLTRLREAHGEPWVPDRFEAEILALEGKAADALTLIEGLPERYVDEDGAEWNHSTMTAAEVRLLHHLGRYADAVDRLLPVVASGISDLHMVDMLQIMRAADVPASRLADALPDALWMPFLAQVLQANATDGDEMLEAMWQRKPSDSGVIAAAAQLAPGLPVLRALEWSVRIRELGYAQDCPLIALAARDGRDPRERAVAAAVALAMYEDARAQPLLGEALALVAPEQQAALREEIAMLAPSAVGQISQPAPAPTR